MASSPILEIFRFNDVYHKFIFNTFLNYDFFKFENAFFKVLCVQTLKIRPENFEKKSMIWLKPK